MRDFSTACRRLQAHWMPARPGWQALSNPGMCWHVLNAVVVGAVHPGDQALLFLQLPQDCSAGGLDQGSCPGVLRPYSPPSASSGAKGRTDV